MKDKIALFLVMGAAGVLLAGLPSGLFAQVPPIEGPGGPGAAQQPFVPTREDPNYNSARFRSYGQGLRGGDLATLHQAALTIHRDWSPYGYMNSTEVLALQYMVYEYNRRSPEAQRIQGAPNGFWGGIFVTTRAGENWRLGTGIDMSRSGGSYRQWPAR